jgi:rhodanese-related sulfurtransferase
MSSHETSFQNPGIAEDFTKMSRDELLVSLNSIIYNDKFRTSLTFKALIDKLGDWEFLQDSEIEKLCLDALKFICRLRPDLITPQRVDEVVGLFDHPDLVAAARAVRVYGYMIKSKPEEINSYRIKKLIEFLSDDVPIVRGEADRVLSSLDLGDHPLAKKIGSYREESTEDLGYTNISPRELKALLEENHVLVIDNRTETEFEVLKSPRLNEVTSLHGNRLIYLKEDDPKDNFKDLLLNDENKIVVICRSGHRSSKLCRRLVQMGYQNVYNLKGGMINWEVGC